MSRNMLWLVAIYFCSSSQVNAVSFTPLGDLPGGLFSSVAHGLSADGSVVVGQATGSSGKEAFRWTLDNGMVGLGNLLGGPFGSDAFGASSDGSVIMSRGRTFRGIEAFVWDASNGMRSVREILTNAGVSLVGWRLLIAKGVSADGSIIVGLGVNPDRKFEAWRADLTIVPEPSALISVAILSGLACATLRRCRDFGR